MKTRTRAILWNLIVTLTGLSGAFADEITLPPWTIVNGYHANGYTTGQSPDPKTVALQAFFFSGLGSVTGTATSSQDILTVAPNTTYRFKSHSEHYGGFNSEIQLTVGGTKVCSTNIGYGVGHRPYSISFTTTTNDARVGLPLRAMIIVTNTWNYHTHIYTSHTNLTLETFEVLRPYDLKIARPSATQVRLSWLAAYSDWILEAKGVSFSSPWVAVTNSPTVQGENRVVTIETQAASQLFRLRPP